MHQILRHEATSFPQQRMQNLITRVGFETRMAQAWQEQFNTSMHEPATNMQ